MVTLGKHLPAEADEALLWLAEGIPPEEVREAVAAPARQKVDPADLAAALEHPDTKRRFVTIHTDDELAAMLEAPLEKWRVFLHPANDDWSRRSFNGPARVLGGAGTGKTVVAIHRARHLASKVFTAPSDRILFTTYTGNLAENIEATLKTFCGPERERIEVVHLHAWAVRFLRNQGHDKDIASPEEIESCWKEAVSSAGVTEFDPAFLRKEWEAVVLANGIETLDGYLKVPRLGRGKTLTRPQRGQLWVVFQKYRQALDRRHRLDWLSLIRQARLSLESRPDQATVPGGRRGRGTGLPPRGMAAYPSPRTARGERPLPGGGRPPTDLRAEGFPLPMRHLDPGAVFSVAHQLPNDRADPGVGDEYSPGRRGGRLGRQTGRRPWLSVLAHRAGTRGPSLRQSQRRA